MEKVINIGGSLYSVNDTCGDPILMEDSVPEHKVKLIPFSTPNYVFYNHKADNENAKFELKELSVETLDELCNEFRKSIFRKAEKIDPR